VTSTRARLALAIVLVVARGTFAAEPPAGAGPRWNFEVKRQNTDRGTESESTKTTLRLERYLQGAITALRLDVPLPDAKTTFAGDPFDPRLGDLKIRAVWRSLDIAGMPWSPRAELTFPTADPETLGSRKYQVMVGARTSGRLRQLDSSAQQFSYGVLLQQTFSIAGDADAKDINYSKLELELLDTWKSRYFLKLTVKPVVDWVKDGNTGAVAELEGAMSFGGGWRTALMAGTRVWGPAVASTYGARLELTVGRRW
jgi:hypothetical protein